MGRITGKDYGRIATLKGLGRTRKFDGKSFECISQGERGRLKKRGQKLVADGIYKAYRVTVGSELWVR